MDLCPTKIKLNLSSLEKSVSEWRFLTKRKRGREPHHSTLAEKSLAAWSQAMSKSLWWKPAECFHNVFFSYRHLNDGTAVLQYLCHLAFSLEYASIKSNASYSSICKYYYSKLILSLISVSQNKIWQFPQRKCCAYKIYWDLEPDETPVLQD